MPLFQYKARSSRGDLLEGQIEAASADSVAAQLLSGGVTPIEIVESQGTGGDAGGWLKALGRHRPDLPDLILLCRQMYSLLKAGVPIVRGIRGLAQSTPNPVMVEVLDDIADDLESGRELSSALARFPDIFMPLFQSMVRVGENTGRLDEVFMRLGEYLEFDRETRERIKTALRYPTMVIVAIAIALGIINVLVIPAFAAVFEKSNVPLPLATRVLIAVSDFFVAWWMQMLAAIAIALAGARHYVRTERGRYQWDKLKLRIPVFGSIVQRATLARFARSFALAYRAGVPLIQALTVVGRAVGNEYVADRVLEMRNGIERGDTLTRTAAATGLFTPLVLQMLAVGEETGSVDDLLEEVAGFYEREVDYEIKNISDAIEPILIVAVGVMVLVLALGVFLPMWDLATAVGLK